uniref:Recombinase family protein n=1 Tax=Pseudomonas monteilii TaxID=76759 RepID=A0A6H1Q769_9PSED|nr:Recombinase family protein [Pseudomonas monteilii]
MVVLLTLNLAATSLTVVKGSASRILISRISFAPSVGLRPPLRPRARAASRPAMVRSRFSSRSYSARVANTFNCIRPPAVLVSMCSVSDSKRTCMASSWAISWSRWERLRPKRESCHTTTVSPGRSAFSICSSSGRLALAPLICSS